MTFVRLAKGAFGRARLAFAAGVAAASFCAAPAGSTETAWLVRSVPVRIMALGDSITAGVGIQGADIGGGGYRGELQRLLDAHGYHYTMIGGRSDFSRTVRMRGHEGYPGYVIRSFPSAPAPQLYGAVTKEALAAYDPDVILLMAGTNDLLRLTRRAPGYSLPNIERSMNALLAQIFFEKPTAVVIVGGIVASPDIDACDVARFDGDADPSCAAGDSPNLKTIVGAYAARGFHVLLAPRMDAAVPRDKAHFPDGIHPCGPGGYEAVARVWMNAIENVTEATDPGRIAGR